MAEVDWNARTTAQFAKKYIAELFADEDIKDVGLEEIEYDDQAKVWSVTVGFTRPWDRSADDPIAVISAFRPQRKRSFKTVRIREQDQGPLVVSVKDRGALV